MSTKEHRPAMAVSDDSQFGFDPAFYRDVADPAGRVEAERFTITIGQGKAWKMSAGQVCRILVAGGSQVGDLNLWNQHDPREYFWAARTRQFHGTHVTTGDRLWSTLPRMRPMATIIGDTLNYGVDADGGRCHDLLGTRCDPYVSTLISGKSFDRHCHSNLTRAILPFGLSEYDVHDVLNVFMVTGLDHSGRYWISGSPAKEGDYLEFFAETDLLCGMSACPAGDVSGPPWGLRDSDIDELPDAMTIAVYDLDARKLENWHQPEPVNYTGRHGIRLPEDGA